MPSLFHRCRLCGATLVGRQIQRLLKQRVWVIDPITGDVFCNKCKKHVDVFS